MLLIQHRLFIDYTVQRVCSHVKDLLVMTDMSRHVMKESELWLKASQLFLVLEHINLSN